MSKIKLNNSFEIDLPILVDTRLLVQANSGGGKSWAIRRILEQSHGKVQHIVIDLEGEFSTLREKFDYVLAGKGGDVPAEPRSAALLARKLLELNVSAIIDLYELDHYSRKLFVKNFLEAMIDAPKELWHQCIIVVDEAHVFCPEKGQSEASNAVIELTTRGRKRGFCAVLATQRLSKLNKDAAAECNNKLIGRTGLDVDMKRASEELGFTTKEQYLSLRALEAGEFFVFGTAISTEVKKIKIGEVQTTHPKAGSRSLIAPTVAPTAKIMEVLGKLSDLPKEAEKEARTMEDFRKQIFELKLKLKQQPRIETKIDEKQMERIKREYEARTQNLIRETVKEKEIYINKINNILKKVVKYAGDIKDLLQTLPSQKNASKLYILPKDFSNMENFENPQPGKFYPVEEVSLYPIEKPIQAKITGGALRMLQVLARRYPMKFTKVQLAALSRLKSSSGTYGTYLSLLRANGYIAGINHIEITQEGLDFVGIIPEEKTDVVQMWRESINGGARRIFDLLVENYPRTFSKEEIAENTGLVASSGTFGTYLSMLRSNNLVEQTENGIKASENLFI